jgi:transposase
MYVSRSAALLTPERKQSSYPVLFTPMFNPLSPELNPICYLLALLAHDFLHVSRIRVKSLTLRLTC